MLFGNIAGKRKKLSKQFKDGNANSDKLLLDEIKKILKEVENDENELSKKLLDIFNNLSKEDKRNTDEFFINFIKFIYLETKKSKKDNVKERLKNFFDFISDIENIKHEYLQKIFEIKCENSDIEKDKDIIFFWKKQIVKEYIKTEEKMEEDFFDAEAIKKLFKLLENNYNLNEIYELIIYFNRLIREEKEELLNSLLSTIKSYPGIELRKYKDLIDDNNNKNKTDNKIALDFYLEVSGVPSKDSLSENKKHEETPDNELFQEIKELNPNISNELIEKIKIQLKQINAVNKDDFLYDKQFKIWVNNKCSKMKFKNNFDSETAEVLGVIFLAIHKEFDYYLRNIQLISILMFIYKEKNKGLIEEIATGEGKSIIIAALSIYYALRNKYVDIITSGYTLAQRDSKKFSKLYKLFNLSTSYPRNYESSPYKANILYGTFLELEGDILRELTSTEKTRDTRDYQVVIVDEVDNLFIDNILGSTRLSNSSRGFKFLAPYYFTTYLSVLLIDFFLKLKLKINVNLIKDEKTKKKLNESIEDPKIRKNEIMNIMKECMNEINKKNFENENQKINIKEKDKKILNDIPSFYENILKYIEYPNFLKNFVKIEEKFWMDSAFTAQNEMSKDNEYVIAFDRQGFKDIAPVDRSNTGEIELSTVYDEGIHQMLEIKHRLRTKEETVVHTFLSHITYFQKYYKKNEEFLFFGLTGTLGNEETRDIYNNQYNSNIMFMPTYKKKRFVELPPILCQKKDHYLIVYENIRLNYEKKRKILVICDSIMEANKIKETICEQEQKNSKNYNKNKDNSSYGDIENDILLYTRSDWVNEEFLEKNSNKKIFLSTNLGGRGTDLKTNQEEENNGGLHVILTSMPKNLRVLKQAFGRTSREGKKGTGQIIIYNEKFSTYSEIVNEMNKEEKKRINYIQGQLDILLFKDELFKKFLNIIKKNNIDTEGFLIEEIKYRWANFLKIYVTSNKEDLDKEEINKKFEEFNEKIEQLLKGKNNIDQKFENKFYQMAEGIHNNRNYKSNIMDYFMFSVDEKNKKFYFAQTYIKAIIKIVNTRSIDYNDEFFSDVLRNLGETKNRIKLLIKECIDPILNSFRVWEQFTNNLIKFGEIEKFMEDNPFENPNFEKTELFEQYSNIKKICNKIIDHIEENEIFIENYKIYYKNDENFSIFVTEKLIEDGLSLDEKEIKEKDFFIDSTFRYVYKFWLKKKEIKDFWLILKKKFLSFLKFISTPFVKIFIFVANKIFKRQFQMIDNDNIELSRDTIFGNIFDLFKRKIGPGGSANIINENDNIETTEDYDLNNTKDLLLSNILNNINIKYNERIKEIKDIDFLLFIDFYLDEDIWKEKIKKIFAINFTQFYNKNIEEMNNENKQFPKNAKDENYKKYLEKYNQIFNSYLEKCLNEIKHLLNKKEFNRSTGLNCLEHLIKNLNPEAITEKIANKTVYKLIECNFISKKGILNKKFLKEKQKQEFKINTNINKNNIIINNKITNLDDFDIDNINNDEIPKVNALFYDLSEIYEKETYNKLSKDYSLYIKNNFIKIVNKMLDYKKDNINKFYELLLKFIKTNIENLLRRKNFHKYNEKSMGNIISANLSPEQKITLSKIIEKTREQVLGQFITK